jgi:hypothetical protein
MTKQTSNDERTAPDLQIVAVKNWEESSKNTVKNRESKPVATIRHPPARDTEWNRGS